MRGSEKFAKVAILSYRRFESEASRLRRENDKHLALTVSGRRVTGI